MFCIDEIKRIVWLQAILAVVHRLFWKMYNSCFIFCGNSLAPYM